MASTTNTNIEEFRQKLLDWYTINGRHFPWRKKRLSQYKIVIAEVLLQRTKAETISKFFAQFIEIFPNWKSLAQASETEIQILLKPIGLHKQRSKRLKSLALEMIKRNGKLPRERSALESIPFMGQYMANAVELLIYNHPKPLIDVNMTRVLERYFGKRKLADIRHDPYLQNLSHQIVNHLNSKEVNWAIIDFAAIVCKAQKPICQNCILRLKCCYNVNPSGQYSK